jgi:hypothetical protein
MGFEDLRGDRTRAGHHIPRARPADEGRVDRRSLGGPSARRPAPPTLLHGHVSGTRGIHRGRACPKGTTRALAPPRSAGWDCLVDILTSVATVAALVCSLATVVAAVIAWRSERSLRLRITQVIEVEFEMGPGPKWKEARARAQRLRRQVEIVSTQRITDLAGVLAGRERMDVRDEWRAHLFGETGQEPPDLHKLGAALGFIFAAIRYRLQDAADVAWRPADVVLASRELSNLTVVLPTLVVAVIFIHRGGLYELASNLVNVAAVWSAAYGLIRAGRWWRGAQPPKHKPRRSKD